MSPTGMLRLPADRLECPLVEPSQQVCPHWTLVVLHQAAREVVYMTLEGLRKCACTSEQPAALKRLKYTPIDSPARALTATKRVCFVRHGQGAHNRSIANWGMVDPELTGEGEAQVADLHQRLKACVDFSEIQLIATSPLTRAMQTATGGFAGCTAPYTILPILRERLGAPCDTGRTKTELLRCFPTIAQWEGIDEMPEVWWATATEYDLLERVDMLKQWITARPEQVHKSAFPRTVMYTGILHRHPTQASYTGILHRHPTQALTLTLTLTHSASRSSVRPSPPPAFPCPCAWGVGVQVIAVVGHGGLFTRILGYHLKNCGFQWVEWSTASSSA